MKILDLNLGKPDELDLQRELLAATILLSAFFIVALVQRYVWDGYFRKKRGTEMPKFLHELVALVIIILAVMFVLTLFSCFAYLYVNTFVRKRQHAVILFVVDGFDLSMLNQARLQLGRSPFDTAWNVALLNLQDPGQPVPDAGVDATAIACGKRVPNGFVAVTRNNEALESLIYIAEQSQRATGLVTTSSLVQPAPVAFY